VPKGNEAEYFGFYSLCGRFAAILGPFLFGIVSALTGDQTLAVLSILIFFIIGIVYLPKTKSTFISS
jgi:UMF1 family MFS transporter